MKGLRGLCHFCVIRMSYPATTILTSVLVERRMPMFTRRPTKLTYLLLCSLPLCLAVSICYALSNQRLTPTMNSDYSNYQCATGTTTSGQTFRVLTLTVMDAVKLANALCNAADIKVHYDKVDVIWHTRGFITAHDIVEQQYDLFLNRPYLVAGLVPDYERYYRPILTSERYSVYWLSKVSTPELTQAYFADKRIGLMDDFYSQSFFLLPSGALSAANIELKDEQKKLFHDLNSLYSAFEAGEVDLITSPDLGAFSEKITPLYNLEIAEQAPPISWFMRRKTGSADLACAVQNILSTTITWMSNTQSNSDAKQECL